MGHVLMSHPLSSVCSTIAANRLSSKSLAAAVIVQRLVAETE